MNAAAEDDDIWDSLFHGCAFAAWLDEAAARRGPPDPEATKRRAYRYYEEALAEKNAGQPPSASRLGIPGGGQHGDAGNDGDRAVEGAIPLIGRLLEPGDLLLPQIAHDIEQAPALDPHLAGELPAKPEPNDVVRLDAGKIADVLQVGVVEDEVVAVAENQE
jgi:hypothetical protein